MNETDDVSDNYNLGERGVERDSSRASEVQRVERLERAEETVTERVGDPEELARHWRNQGPTNDCAIYAEGTSLEAFGKEFDPEQERRAGQEEGVYSPERGTNEASVGRVWERHGMAVERYPPPSTSEGAGDPQDPEAAFSRLSTALEDRRGVVAVVDSGPLWHSETNSGHAVWVTGLETRESGSQYVVVNDSGSPDGQAKAYPMTDFESAWGAHGYDMVITRDQFPSKEAKQ